MQFLFSFKVWETTPFQGLRTWLYCTIARGYCDDREGHWPERLAGRSINPEQWLVQGGILFFCAVVQSTVGFAFSLFSNALLLMAGLALPETVMLSTLGSTTQRLVMTSSMHRHVALMLTTFGKDVLPSPLQVPILVPAVVIGAFGGMAAGQRLLRHRLRVAAPVLLTAIGVLCVLDPLLRRLR